MEAYARAFFALEYAAVDGIKDILSQVVCMYKGDGLDEDGLEWAIDELRRYIDQWKWYAAMGHECAILH